MAYKVFVDDNYHYMDKDKRYTLGEFETLEAAVEAAKGIVDDGVLNDYEPGMSASTLYGRYKMFGEDPWVSGPGDSHFSAWKYAEACCEIICAGMPTTSKLFRRKIRYVGVNSLLPPIN
jgi:hypothetical protein